MIIGGGRVTIFDRFKKMLILEEKQKIKESLAERQNKDKSELLPTDGKQIIVTQSDTQMRVSQLTPREHDLYLLLLEGFTLKESAEQLSIKYSTANTHMSSIYKKLGVNSRAGLIINYRMINK